MKPSTKEKIKDNAPYLVFYIFGIIAALISPLRVIEEGLSVLGPITLTALFASLLVPFAAFSQKEKWQKFCMQYVLTSLFGMYTVVLKEKGAATGFILFACAAVVHIAYWMSSIHSRQYRLEQFRLGFANEMPATARLIAMLNGLGRSEQSDTIICHLIRGTLMDMTWMGALLSEFKGTVLRDRVIAELGSVYHKTPSALGFT